MQSKNTFFGAFIVVGLLCLLACAPAPVAIKEKLPPSPELIQALERFKTAEDLFQQQAYSEAIAIYQDHLRRFPRGPLGDTALMKTGLICMAMKDYLQARHMFKRLVHEYPKSSLVEDARFNVILAYYEQGSYSAAIKSAISALGFAATRYQKSRIYDLMGYSYSANNEFEDAIKSYMIAYELAEPQKRTEILSKVKEVIACLKEPELNSLLEVYKHRVPSGHLRLQLAKEYASEDRIQPAIDVLSDFFSLFPQHEELETAMALMDELKLGLLTNRFSIGCILPLSGPYEKFGNRALTGIELALNQFNTQPDVNQIQLVIKDSKGDPNEAARAVESLVLDDGVIGIIGPMITSESAAVQAQALKVPIMTLTQKPDITKLGDYVFRDFLTLSQQVKAVVSYTVHELGIKRIAILYPEERYGIASMNTFWDVSILHGAEIVGVESYGPDQTDFADAIKKLVGLYYPRPEEPEEESTEQTEILFEFLAVEEEAEAPFPDTQGNQTSQPGLPPSLSPLDETSFPEDQPPEQEQEEPAPIVDFGAVFIPDTFEKVSMIAPQFPYYDVANVLLLGSNLWHSDKLIQMARSYVQGAVVPDGFFRNSPSPSVQNFVKSFKDVFGIPPGYLEAQTYDAASILFQLVNKPEVRSRRKMKLAIMELKDFPGVTGRTSFDETGDVSKQIYLLKIKGGRFVQVEP